VTPEDIEDAKLRMTCHNQAVEDFNIQLQMVDIEINAYTDCDYNQSKVDDLEDRKLKLLAGKRFHANASHAYWYYIEKQKANAA
jgi:hypothetical protein